MRSAVRSAAKATVVSSDKEKKAATVCLTSAESNKVKFQYPNCQLKWSDNSAVFSSLSHKDRLVKTLEAVTAQEAAALETYFQELSESTTHKALKPELLLCLQEVLTETVAEVEKQCPADIEFHPEVTSSVGNGTVKTDILEAKRNRLQAQADELDGYLQNIGDFGKKYNVSTSQESIDLLYQKIIGSSDSKLSSRSGEKVRIVVFSCIIMVARHCIVYLMLLCSLYSTLCILRQYGMAANQLSDIVSHINRQCDDVIEKYINTNVKGTLSFVEKSQAGLYDTYQKVRGSRDPVIPKNKLLSPSYPSSRTGSADTNTAKSLEVHDYVNLLQSQTGNSKPFTGGNSGGVSSGGSSSSQGQSKTQHTKKLLKGFGKS